MWTEKGNGDQDTDQNQALIERARAAEKAVQAANRREALQRERLHRLKFQARQDPLEAYLEAGGSAARVFVPMLVLLAALAVAAVVAWAIVHGVHEDREFTRSCEARGGWVNEDVGGHWATVPVTRSDAKGNTSVTWEQQYRPGPTYCVVDGVNVARR